MSTMHSFRKNITVNPNLRFPLEMYNNIVGSLIITAYILSDEKPEVKDIVKGWTKLKKKGMNYWLDDPEFFEKTLQSFGLQVPYGKFAMVQSELNALFMPYIDEQIYPIREDGILPNTAVTGKVYPIVKEDKKETE